MTESKHGINSGGHSCGGDHDKHAAGLVVDEVCGMAVDPKNTAHHETYAGYDYHFCSAGCRERFITDPQKYLNQSAADRVVDAPAGTIWTCPMHPEVRQDHPGACPICGMGLEPEMVSADTGPSAELIDMRRRFWIGLALALPVFILEMGGHLFPALHHLLPMKASMWIQFALATPVVLWAGWPFFERGWASLKTRNLNMFTLIAMGTGVAWTYSVIAMLAPGIFPDAFRAADGTVAVYFEAAAVITVLVLLGQVLELRARERTSGAIKALLNLAPKTARRIDIDGSEAEILAPDVVCSILTVDKAGLLHPLAGPSLPAAYSEALDSLKIGPLTGSCGAAAYSRAEVEVINIASDDRWADFKHLALPLGLRACWSSPILGTDGAAIGTFAFYYRECRGPTDTEREIVRQFVHLSAIALDRHQRVMEHERRAFTDALTGLANRAAFNAALNTLHCDVPGAWALFTIDLDNLKVINDTFGHQAGDCLLQIAGARLTSAVSPDVAFRIGGDEFAAIVQSKTALRDLQSAADKILSKFAEPADCAGNLVAPRATIGGAVVSAGDRVAERVRQHADFALYHAKETGRGGFVRYWPGLGTNMTRRLGNIRDVDSALREDRIEAYYQPVVRLDTREIVGLEALCRMRIGDQIVPAVNFQEATKDVHVATALTERMMGLVAADVRAWLDMGIPFQHVGINVSSADMHGGMLEQMLVGAFEGQRVPLSHVILEITEAVYMSSGDRIVRNAAEALRAKGLRVALDDFGTGYASLTHLRTVPVDILKIDKSFVDRLAPGDASTAIIEGLIHIAKQLNIRVIAEGVETEEQAERLKRAGCTLGQGYLFSPAVDRQRTTTLLTNYAQHRKGGNVGDPTVAKLPIRRS